MIETTSFRLLDGVEDVAFLAVDAQLQAEFAYAQPGLLRRTMTRSTTEPSRWQEFVLWAGVDEADAAHRAARDAEVVTRYAELVDHSTIEQQRYDETS